MDYLSLLLTPLRIRWTIPLNPSAPVGLFPKRFVTSAVPMKNPLFQGNLIVHSIGQMLKPVYWSREKISITVCNKLTKLTDFYGTIVAGLEDGSFFELFHHT
jgi:hypothetical protein